MKKLIAAILSALMVTVYIPIAYGFNCAIIDKCVIDTGENTRAGGVELPDDSFMAKVTIDGISHYRSIGSKASFTAEHIRIDEKSGNILAFEKWNTEGITLSDNSKINIEAVIPDGSVVLTPEYFVLGNLDRNPDGMINAIDVFTFLRGIKDGATDKTFDIDLDGKVTSLDKLMLLKIVKGVFDIEDFYYTLSVEGNDIRKLASVATDKGSVELPLVAMLEAYAASITWLSESVAEIEIGGASYTLNIGNCTMYAQGGKTNILSGVSGGFRTYTTAEKELFVEIKTAEAALKKVVDANLAVNISYDNRTIAVNVKN
ncbi:MAG: hypothetical protein IJ499_06585 [Clostridia bacterium]|nr:hypothetical protein [Clostridia bacterium]